MADDARAKRAAALEERKRRLAELKARKTARSSAAPADSAAATKADRGGGGGNLDEYIDGLLSAAPPAVAAAPAVSAEAEAPKPEAAIADGGAEKKGAEGPSAASAPSPPAPPAVEAPPPAKQVETFTFGTQTEDDDFPPPSEASDADEESKAEREGADGDGDKEGDRKETERKDEETVAAPAPRALSGEEVAATVSTAPFSAFLNSASKKVERLLGASVLADLLVDADYVGETDAEAEAAERKKERGAGAGSALIGARHSFQCTPWTGTRDATDLDWSPVHRELMLASYHMPSSSSGGSGGGGGGGSDAAVTAIGPGDTPSASLAPRSGGELRSDGLALVWSLAMPSRPEHVFTCGSPVLASRFHPTEHHLVVGGCHSGQLVVWDIRAGRLPVQRSSLATVASSLGGHSHPICSMEIVEGGSGLVTAATDGRLNFWSLANLRDPAETLVVGGNVSSLAVAPESNSILCGDESGNLHAVLASAGSAAASSSSASRRVVKQLDAGEGGSGHFGMITGLAAKAEPRAEVAGSGPGMSRGFLRGPGGLVLSCGVDWMTKLWAPAYTDKPLLTFLSHSYDYMCDVKWSPTHPSMFATASSNGTLGIWNLASSLDEPISGSEGIVVEDGASAPRGLNKIKWSSDGRRIAVASADSLHVLGMSEEFSRPKGDEDAKLMGNLISRGFLEEE